MSPAAENLGALEHVVLLALARLGDNAYGVTIRAEIESRTGRSLSLGAIYPTLDRLEQKGLVSSRIAESTGVRGGRSRRLFYLEQPGADALVQYRDQLASLWAGLRLKVRSSY